MGFVKAGSKASLIASSVFAAPLILCALGFLSLTVAVGILAFLTLFFAARFAKSRKMMPNGVMALASLVAAAAIYALTHPGA